MARGSLAGHLGRSATKLVHPHGGFQVSEAKFDVPARDIELGCAQTPEGNVLPWRLFSGIGGLDSGTSAEMKDVCFHVFLYGKRKTGHKGPAFLFLSF